MRRATKKTMVNKRKYFYISEMADFMGLSTRTLARMDADGRLRADRSPSGYRIYTTKHILQALDILGGAQNISQKVSYCKTGQNSYRGKLLFPKKWLECMGVTEDEPEVDISFDGRQITVKKASR